MVVLLSGCGSSESTLDPQLPQPETGYQHLQVAVAEDIATLVDADGLVANPFDDSTLPLDFYGTALLAQAVEQLDLPSVVVTSEKVASAEVEAYRTRSGITDDWLAYSLHTLGIGAEVAADISDASSGGDADERATRLWLRSMIGSAGTAAQESVVVDDVVDDPDLGAVGLERVLEACDRGGLECRRTMPIEGTIGIDDVEEMLSTRATLRLIERGVDVRGVSDLDRGELAAAAEQTIDTAPGGYELEVSALATIAFDADGRTRAFSDYLERSSARRDPATGVYRMYAEPRGTVSNTFEAVLAVGPYWSIFLQSGPVVAAVERDLAERDAAVDPVADVEALYVKSLVGSLDGRDRERLGTATATCRDAGTDSDLRVRLAQLLPLLGEVSCRPLVDPGTLDATSEAQQLEAIGAAQSGTLENSAEVMSHFSGVVSSLPHRAVSDEIDDPMLLDRLEVLANDRDLLTGREWDEVAERMSARVGCASTPHLVRVSTDAQALCDIGLTRRAMSLGIDYREG